MWHANANLILQSKKNDIPNFDYNQTEPHLISHFVHIKRTNTSL